MATHSSIFAWRIPGTGEPGGLPSMGSHRVGHDWSDLTVAVALYCLLNWGWGLCWFPVSHLPGTWSEAINHSSLDFSGLFMGLPMRTGLYRLLPLWLGLSITPIHVNHHQFWETDRHSYPTSELCPNTKFLRSLRSLKNKRGYALPNSSEIFCVWEQSGMLFQWPPPPFLGCCSP